MVIIKSFIFHFELMKNHHQNLILSIPLIILNRSCLSRGNNNCSDEVHNPGATKIVNCCSPCGPKSSPRNLGKCKNTMIPSYAATTSSYLWKRKDKTISYKSKFLDIMKSCPKRPQFRPLKKPGCKQGKVDNSWSLFKFKWKWSKSIY